MKVQTIYHTGFVVDDLERSLEFYTGLLGMVIEREPVVADAPWLAEVVGAPLLALWTLRSGQRQ